MTAKSIGWLCFFLVSSILTTKGQTVTKVSNQQWIQYYNSTDLSARWKLNYDGGFRWRDGEPFFYIARASVGYQLNSKFRASLGIGTMGTFTNSELSVVEVRPHQEILHSDKLNKINISNRLRIEERFFNRLEINGTPASHDFNFRFRYQLAFMIPIATLSKAHPDRKLSLSISDELFINAGSLIVYNTFDRNRVVVGPSFQLSKPLTVALLYNFQYAKENQPGVYDVDHVLWFTIRHTITKKSDN